MKPSAMQALVIRSLLVLCAALGMAAGSARAQGVEVFLKLDGVKGESTVKGYEGLIQAQSMHMDVKTSVSTATAGGGSASVGKAQLSDFVITKPVDSTSPLLFMNCASGKMIKSAVISLRRGGNEPVEFLKYTLSDVMISSVSVSTSGDAPTEQVSLAYLRIDIECKPIGADGKAGAPVKSSWDVKSNKAVSSGGTGDAVASSGDASTPPAGGASGGEAAAGEPEMAPAETTPPAVTPPAKQTELAPAGRTVTGGAVTRAPREGPSRAGAAVPLFTQAANAELKGRLGRLLIRYPKEADPSGTAVAVHRAGEEKALWTNYGDSQTDLLPGSYIVSISQKKIADVPVAAGSETRLHLGVLSITAAAATRVDVLDSDKKTELVGGYGNQLIGLPIGTYYVRVAGQSEAVTITDGKVTEF